MTDTANAHRSRVGALRIILPASWWTIELRDAESRHRSVAALVEQQVGRADERAALRADARRILGGAADDAATSGGEMMAVSLMEADGIPVPATVTVYRVPGGDLTEHGVRELEAVLRAAPEGFESLDLAEAATGALLRRVSRRAAPAGLGADKLSMLIADYWLDPDDGRGLLCFTFSSPLVEQKEALLELFDAVVASIEPDEQP